MWKEEEVELVSSKWCRWALVLYSNEVSFELLLCTF